MTSQIGAAVIGFVQAIIGLAVLFGVHLTMDQMAGIMAAVGAGETLLFTILHISTQASLKKPRAQLPPS